MPITLDGAGTISGLATGGLPDGSVNNADLAANAVSTSKILDGAVTTAKLGTNEASGLCKAWVNFNGTGVVAIRASYNVSSITDNGVGDYTVNFTTALADANYAAHATSKSDGASTGYFAVAKNAAQTTTAFSVITIDTSGIQRDTSQVSVAIFR